MPALRRIQRARAFLRVLLIAAVVLPFGFLGAVGWTTYGWAIAEAQMLVRRTVDVLHEHILKVFETQELILDQAVALASGMPFDRDPDYGGMDEVLMDLEKGRDQIASIWILDAVGDVRIASAPSAKPLNGRDRDYFQAHVAGDVGTYVGKAFVGRATGRSSFGFSRRWPSPDGSFRGVISISVSSDYFSNAFHRAAPDMEHEAALIRADGEILARDPPNPSLPPFPPDDPLMRAVAAADSGLLWRASRVDGIERLYGYRRIDGYPLLVSMSVTRSAVLHAWLAGFVFYAGITCLVAFGLSGLTAFALLEMRKEEAALLRLAAESRQREQIEARLRQSQKLEALGQVTGTVAHDFGNLLTPILGTLRSLQRQPDHPRTQSRLGGALAAAERGENLVRSLLAFARQQQLAITTIDVNEVIGAMADLLSQSLDSAAKLILEPAPEVWPVRADVGQLEMAILNLVVNARDAMTAEGTVRISTANAALHGEHGLQGDYVAIAVSDTGTGMTPEVLAHAFEPLFTTKPQGKGTGLGLSSTYGFAKQCGGGAAIDSEAGKGTTVTIYLPRAEPATI